MGMRLVQPVPAKPLTNFLVTIVALIACSGCRPSSSDALRHARRRIAELKSQQRQVQRTAEGKWYGQGIEIRNANLGYQSNGVLTSTVSYEYRILRTGEFDNEANAQDAPFLPAQEEAWQSKKEVFVHKGGKWQPEEQ